MARRSDVAEVEETEVVETPTEGVEVKEPKAKKEPARGELPESYVTPIGLAKILTERELHTDKNGGHEVRPQMVYSYIKNASKEDAFPLETVKDSLGKDRQAVTVEAGVAWWERKNERVAAKRANAAAKKAAKEQRAVEKAAAKEAEGAESSEDSQAVEAE